ncbi:MAG: hypothetical protein ACK41F_07395 [Fimbriimonadaceae bacterium]
MRVELTGTWTLRASVRLFGRRIELGRWKGALKESAELASRSPAYRRWETGPLVWILSLQGDALEARAETLGGLTLWRQIWDLGRRLDGRSWPLRASGHGLSVEAEVRLTDS